jgi:hypothetical protein
MVSTRASSTQSAASKQPPTRDKSQLGWTKQTYIPRHDHPSYKPQYAANFLLLNELQENLLPKPANASKLFSSLEAKTWHMNSRKLNNDSAVFGIKICTSKYMTPEDSDDPTTKMYTMYKVKAEAYLVDSSGNLGEYSKFESSILIWIT